LFGQGDNGVGGAYNTQNGGSGALFSSSCNTSSISAYSPQVGGGGAASILNAAEAASSGGHGAVRILWGKGREFPSTDVGQS